MSGREPGRGTSGTSDRDLHRLAVRQLADYDARTPGTLFAEEDLPFGIEDAYRLQLETARLRNQRGEATAGYKIGCVSPTVRGQLGVEHPVFGHLFASEIRSSPAALSAEEFCNLGVEGEFALRLGSDATDLDALRADPARFVDRIYPVIELHNVVFRAPPQARAAELIANNAFQAGIVIPSEIPEWDGGDTLEIRVSIDEKVRDEAIAAPLETLVELATRLADFGLALRKGQIVLAGSPLPLYSLVAGERVQVEWPGRARVDAAYGGDENQDPA